MIARVFVYFFMVVGHHSPYLIFNVYIIQEFLVKNADRVELMAMLGTFGAIVSAIQMYPWYL